MNRFFVTERVTRVINEDIKAALLSICLFTVNLNKAKNIIQAKVYESISLNIVFS